MPRIKYKDIRMSADRMMIVSQANTIIAEYQAQGFSLTLRQLYYQFVSRDILPNSQKSYSKLGDVVSDARMAGLIDWYAIEDRTRNVRSVQTWNDPAEIMRAVGSNYRTDKWAKQPYRVVVMIEKDALIGVIEGICNELEVPYFSCRGYTSQSEMWAMAQRLLRYRDAGQEPLILHLGDHDPSGIDMTRDITDRLETFMGGTELKRLALNWDQVERYAPPPNYAKITDPRAARYIEEFGDSSWELDALAPQVIADLVRDAVYSVRDIDLWEEATGEQEEEKKHLQAASTYWNRLVSHMEQEGYVS